MLRTALKILADLAALDPAIIERAAAYLEGLDPDDAGLDDQAGHALRKVASFLRTLHGSAS